MIIRIVVYSQYLLICTQAETPWGRGPSSLGPNAIAYLLEVIQSKQLRLSASHYEIPFARIAASTSEASASIPRSFGCTENASDSGSTGST